MGNVGRFIFFSLLVVTLVVSSWLRRSIPPQFVGTEKFAPVPTSTTYYTKPIEIPEFPKLQVEPIPGPVVEIQPIHIPQYQISPAQVPQYRVDPYIVTPRVEPIRAPVLTSIPRHSPSSSTASPPVSGGITGVNPRERGEAKLSAKEAGVIGEISELTEKKAVLEAKRQALEELEQKRIKLDAKKRELKELERQARKKGVRP